MSNVAGLDDNSARAIFGVSHVDGVTPVQIRFDAMRRMLTDDTTSIQFNPAIRPNQNVLNSYPFAKATSLADDETTAPWVVNESTGAVLITN